jgi:hypothetical protein
MKFRRDLLPATRRSPVVVEKSWVMRDFARRPQASAPRRRSAHGSRGRLCEWPAERQVKSTIPVRILATIANMNRELACSASVQSPELATRVRILTLMPMGVVRSQATRRGCRPTSRDAHDAHAGRGRRGPPRGLRTGSLPWSLRVGSFATMNLRGTGWMERRPALHLCRSGTIRACDAEVTLATWLAAHDADHRW